MSVNAESPEGPNRVAEFPHQIQTRLDVLESRVEQLEESAVTEAELDDDVIDEHGERIDELGTSVKAALSIFDGSHVDKALAHARARESDDQDGQPSVGDVVEVHITDPPAEGEDPSTAVGRIDGKVTFVHPEGHDIGRETVRARIEDVKQNVNVARAVGKA